MKRIGLLLWITLMFQPGFTGHLFSQQVAIPQNQETLTHTPELKKGRLLGIAVGGSVLYAGTMTALYHAWYKNHPQTSFHFQEDLGDWLQMDKGGHMVSSYNIGRMGFDMLRWAGVERKNAVWIGGMLGSVYLTTIEILDGFSAGWGASMSDFAANSIGSAAFISQQLIWDEQRIQLKFSYHPTKYAAYRPDLLGSNHLERILKDYNGHTYWLSANLNAFGLDNFPQWLNIAIGFGSGGLTGVSKNITGYFNGKYIPDYKRVRKYYLSFDIDLTRIETRSQFINRLLESFGFIKVPFPAVEYGSDKKFRFYPLYL